ncbi:DUF4179 domain-containing protein [Cytobacillus oceanisediminis]|uniref:DUF4179 domain-containing protein n=1 Tax=Cytobacillus oceanisediminis TaxID=665099 RepID=UPI001C232E02|nr:DUF4179 domain-containing protein [Cytobacillus oceanisediminis]MBU8733768.1 DUF4179 domain-containing protein [Cytobacillus oceanisediminis]
MTIYNKLNDVEINLDEFEEIELSKLEKKRILKRVKKDISLGGTRKKWVTISVGVAAIIMSAVLIIDKETVADMPFIGEKIEKYININENLDYSSYKTNIGSTAENGLGKLTLNEVIVDDQRIYVSSTFQPTKNVDVDYQTAITPRVKINGQDTSLTTGGETIELSNNMFTIFNDIELSQEIKTEEVDIEIIYDRWDRTIIDQPWVFKIGVSQSRLMKEKKVFDMNTQLTLNNGEIVTLQKVVTTPMSTTVYYNLSQISSEDIRFKIQTQEGTIGEFSSAFNSNSPGVMSYARFNGITLNSGEYFLMAYDSNDNELIKEAVPIK